jgi:hypothetical protein
MLALVPSGARKSVLPVVNVTPPDTVGVSRIFIKLAFGAKFVPAGSTRSAGHPVTPPLV